MANIFDCFYSSLKESHPRVQLYRIFTGIKKFQAFTSHCSDTHQYEDFLAADIAELLDLYLNSENESKRDVLRRHHDHTDRMLIKYMSQ
jgi:hypothetical protein